jgi:hypothetical protein
LEWKHPPKSEIMAFERHVQIRSRTVIDNIIMQCLPTSIEHCQRFCEKWWKNNLKSWNAAKIPNIPKHRTYVCSATFSGGLVSMHCSVPLSFVLVTSSSCYIQFIVCVCVFVPCCYASAVPQREGGAAQRSALREGGVCVAVLIPRILFACRLLPRFLRDSTICLIALTSREGPFSLLKARISGTRHGLK